MDRVDAILQALAGVLGRGWGVGSAAPIGLGTSEGHERRALVHEEQPIFTQWTIYRGVVIWSTTRRGDTAWHYEVDDGHGWIATGSAATLPRMIRSMWSDLWEATADPVDLVCRMLTDIVSRGHEGTWQTRMGPPQQSMGIVRWGFQDAVGQPALWLSVGHAPLQIIVDPAVTGGTEGWPAVECRGRWRRVRRHLPPAALARWLVAVAVATARATFETGDLVLAAAGDEHHHAAPRLPTEVEALLSAAGTLVDDWPERLDDYIASEGAPSARSRRRRARQRAELRLALPGDGLDECGQVPPLYADEVPVGRLEIPVALLGALWCAGLSLRAIADITTGRDTSRNTINQRIRAMRHGADGWDRSTTGQSLLEQAGLVWMLDEPDRQEDEQDDADLVVRVRRREPVLSDVLDAPPVDEQDDASGSRLVVRVRRRDPLAGVPFAAALSPEARRFAEMVAAAAPAPVMLGDVMEQLGIDRPKAVGGLIAEIAAAAGEHGDPVRQRNFDGERGYMWRPVDDPCHRRDDSRSLHDVRWRISTLIIEAMERDPVLRALDAPGLSWGWVTWGRAAPPVVLERLGGQWIELVVDPPLAETNSAHFHPPVTGRKTPYVRHGDWWEAVEGTGDSLAHAMADVAIERARAALGVTR